MGGRGSGGWNRKSPDLHRLMGTFRPGRHARVSRLRPVGQDAVPEEPPDWLGEDAKAFWRRHRPICLAMKTLDNLSLPAFELLCAQWGLYMLLTRQIQREGEVVPGPRGPKPHPLLAARRQVLQQVTRLLGDFGLTPAGRARLGITWPPEREDDPFGRFLEEARQAASRRGPPEGRR